MIKFLDLNKQYQSIKDEIDRELFNVITTSAFIKGKYVDKFEEEFSDYCEAQYCIGCGNGTDALELAIESLNLPEGSEIIIPANTFVATAEAIVNTGHKIRFCDCDETNYTIDIESLKEQINPNTSAVIAVHLYGHPCDIDSIAKICQKYDLKLIEDAAQAHGARYKGKRVGSLADVAAFSFYPGKNLGAYGDGGAVVSNDEKIAEFVRRKANHGALKKFDNDIIGRNSRLDGLQAAVLSVKLKYLDKWNQTRREVANLYKKYLESTNLVLPAVETWAEPVYHLYVVQTKTRSALINKLEENDVQFGIHYPISLTKLKPYKNEQVTGHFFAVKSDGLILSLPMGEHITENDIATISKIINSP